MEPEKIKGFNGNKLGKNEQSKKEQEYFKRCTRFSDFPSLMMESDMIQNEEIGLEI